MTASPVGKEAIRIHLFGTNDGDVGIPYHYTSGFLACLGDARRATGRDEITGEVLEQDQLHNWLGAVGYIILLDQMGKCFRPDDVEEVTANLNTIEKALIYWASEVDEAARHVIYALRNALAHDYSLFNASGPSRYDVLFTLDRADRLIAPAEQRWDRNYANRNPDVRTSVSVVALGRLVENIVGRIRKAFTDDLLHIALAGGIEELTNRYGMFVPYEPADPDVVRFYPVTGSSTGASVTYVAPLSPREDHFVTGGIPPVTDA